MFRLATFGTRETADAPVGEINVGVASGVEADVHDQIPVASPPRKLRRAPRRLRALLTRLLFAIGSARASCGWRGDIDPVRYICIGGHPLAGSKRPANNRTMKRAASRN